MRKPRPEPPDYGAIARRLCGTASFHGIDPHELRETLARHPDFEIHREVYSMERSVAESGSRLKHLILVDDGTVVAWQIPVSRLEAPYLLGEHEFSAGLAHWIATYSVASPRCEVLWIPVELMHFIVRAHGEVQNNIMRSLFQRISRYYWTSLATSGTPSSQVAAALMSRLALKERDVAGAAEAELFIQQKELARLTNLSRPGVSHGLQALQEQGLIERRGSEHYKNGWLRIRDVERLRDMAFEYFRKKILPGQTIESGESGPFPPSVKETAPGRTFCTNCGVEGRTTARYCRGCGTAFQ